MNRCPLLRCVRLGSVFSGSTAALLFKISGKVADVGKPAHFSHMLNLKRFIGEKGLGFFNAGFNEICLGRPVKKTGIVGIKLAPAEVHQLGHGGTVPILLTV